jgi:hypothetical protein
MDFIRRHRGELNANWKVRQNDTDYNILKFNESNSNPLIAKSGWIEFQEFHELPEDVAVVLRYRGNNIFELAHYEEIRSLQSIPSFHSRSLCQGSTDFFEMELTYWNTDVPTLVSGHTKFNYTLLFK